MVQKASYKVRLYVKYTKVQKIKSHLNGVIILPYEQISDDLKDFQAELFCSRDSPAAALELIWLKNMTKFIMFNNLIIFLSLKNIKNKNVVAETPVALLKSIKNSIEIKGMFEANLRAALCHCQILQWIEENSGSGITETDAAEMLQNFYNNQPGFKVRNFFKLEKVSFNFQGLSFETIASTGPNTAIAHYAPERGSDEFLNYSIFLGK